MSDRGKSTVVSSRSGWVGHPTKVQVRTRVDVRVHQASIVDEPRVSLAEGVVYGTGRLCAGLVELTAGALQFCAWIVFSVLALGVWTMGRTANVVLFCEAKLGGSHKRLVYSPRQLRRDLDAMNKELPSGD